MARARKRSGGSVYSSIACATQPAVRAIVKIVSPAVAGMCAVVEKAPNAKSMFGLVREWRCAAPINAWAARRLRVPGVAASIMSSRIVARGSPCASSTSAAFNAATRLGVDLLPQPVPPLL